MRVSFERGFIDYIKHSNEQRINMLSEALEEQYSHHGNWVFLRNNDQVIYQIMRSFEQNSDSSHNLAHPVLGGGQPVQPPGGPLRAGA